MKKDVITKEVVFERLDKVIHESAYMGKSYKWNEHGTVEVHGVICKAYGYYGVLDGFNTLGEFFADYELNKTLPMKEWSRGFKCAFSSVKRSIQNEKRSNMLELLLDMSNGQLMCKLNELGFITRRITDNGKSRLVVRVDTATVLNVVIDKLLNPVLKEEFGISGVKARKNATLNSYDVLDFSNAEFE